MDAYIQDVGNDSEKRGLAGPPFVPQEPPRKLGIARLIVLILMFLVAGAEALLLGGLWLAYSVPGILPG